MNVATKWLSIILIIGVLISICYWGIKAVTSSGQPPLVMAAKPVIRGDIEVTVRGWGMLQAKEERDVIAGVEGIIKDTFFEAGQQVSAGQILATINAGSLEVKVKQKEINLEIKRVELAKAFGVSPDQVEDVDPEMALVIKSPMAGRVVGLTVSDGGIASGQVCSIVDDSRIRIEMQVPKVLFDLLKLGQDVSFKADRFDGWIKGKLIKADPDPIQGEQAYYYEIILEFDNPGLLRLGDKGIVTLHTTKEDYQYKAEISSFGGEEIVFAPFQGRVKTVHVKEGMVVQAGEPILQLEPGDALLSAMATQLQFKQELMELEDMKAQLNNLTIVSPIDGVAMYKSFTEGMAVGKGSIITRISNYTSMNLNLRVDEIDIPKISTGQMAQLLVWGPEGRMEVTGYVSDMGAQGNPQDGIASFNITVEVNNPGYLRPAMSAEAQIYVSNKEDVLLCPIEALYKEEGEWVVDIKEEENQRRRCLLR